MTRVLSDSELNAFRYKLDKVVIHLEVRVTRTIKPPVSNTVEFFAESSRSIQLFNRIVDLDFKHARLWKLLGDSYRRV